jgi:hypothetical protein
MGLSQWRSLNQSTGGANLPIETTRIYAIAQPSVCCCIDVAKRIARKSASANHV